MLDYRMADLPDEVLQVLPSDPQRQLELACTIITNAYGHKMAQMEAEAQQLRDAVISKSGHIKTLERRVTSLEQENKTAVEEGHRTASEKGALIETVKRLNREIAKLEGFKRSLIQHLQEEDEPSQLDRSMAAVDLSSERLVADVLNSAQKSGPSANAKPEYQTRSQSTPGPTASSFRGVTSSRQGLPTSPPPLPYPTHPSASSYSNSQPSQGIGGGYRSQPSQSAGPGGGSSGAYGSPPAMDGKEFFKQARARLSYEQFSSFLTSIKDLNAGRHTRDHTLAQAREVFGVQHSDLYGMFESLLSRHLTGFV